MTTLSPAPARVKFDSARVARPARPFGAGLLRSLPSARVPYAAADAAFERARSLSLDAGTALPCPADLATTAERDAWRAGAADAERAINDRLEALALDAEWMELCEARTASPHGEFRD